MGKLVAHWKSYPLQQLYVAYENLLIQALIPSCILCNHFSKGEIITSIRRLMALPSDVSLEARGRLDP